MLQVAARYENTKRAPMTRAITEKIKSLSAGPTQ
jgi:hypothetical protein